MVGGTDVEPVVSSVGRWEIDFSVVVAAMFPIKISNFRRFGFRRGYSLKIPFAVEMIFEQK